MFFGDMLDINISLLTGIFHCTARITPLLKKNLHQTLHLKKVKGLSVILLSFVAKTLEGVVFIQVSSFLSQNNQLDVNQAGFKCSPSSETALLSDK